MLFAILMYLALSAFAGPAGQKAFDNISHRGDITYNDDAIGEAYQFIDVNSAGSRLSEDQCSAGYVDKVLPTSAKKVLLILRQCLTAEEEKQLLALSPHTKIFYIGQQLKQHERKSTKWHLSAAELNDRRLSGLVFAESEMPQAGQQYAFRFKITKPLGRGLFGAVFEAQDMSHKLSGSVALKIAFSDKAVLMLNRELGFMNLIAMNSWSAPSKVQAHYRFIMKTAEPLFVPLQYCGSAALILPKLSSRCNKQENPARWIKQTLAALIVLKSSNLVHNDLKPHNLLFRQGEGNQCDIVLSDFGSTLLATDANNAQSMMGGTKEFQAPEQYNVGLVRSDTYSHPFGFGYDVDLFAAGLTLFDWLIDMPNGFAGQESYFHQAKADHKHESLQVFVLHTMQAMRKSQSFDDEFKASDLISQCIQEDLTKRISLEDAFCHPYVQSVQI